MKISNWTANDVFSKTRKLAIVTRLIGGLGQKTALAMSRWTTAMKLFSRSSIVPPTSLFSDRFRGFIDGYYFQ
jgi:hypothetical protein